MGEWVEEGPGLHEGDCYGRRHFEVKGIALVCMYK